MRCTGRSVFRPKHAGCFAHWPHLCRTCAALVPHLCRTCAALVCAALVPHLYVPHLCRTCAALVPYLCRTCAALICKTPIEVAKLGFPSGHLCRRPRRDLPMAATILSHAPYPTCPIHPQKACESAKILPWLSPPPLSLPSSSSPPQADSPSSRVLPSLPSSAPLPATTAIPLSASCPAIPRPPTSSPTPMAQWHNPRLRFHHRCRRRRCGCAINPRIRTITNALSRQDFSCPARLPRLGHGPYPPKRRRRPLSPPLIADVDLNLHTRHATANALRRILPPHADADGPSPMPPASVFGVLSATGARLFCVAAADGQTPSPLSSPPTPASHTPRVTTVPPLAVPTSPPAAGASEVPPAARNATSSTSASGSSGAVREVGPHLPMPLHARLSFPSKSKKGLLLG